MRDNVLPCEHVTCIFPCIVWCDACDVYSHPAAIQYAANHPRRTIPKFGPYLLLHTLGEGEFGKVKLGLHTSWGEEVAVKLIKRHNIDSAVRMSKVEREIEMLLPVESGASFG